MLREVLGQAFFALTLFGCLILVLATLALIFLLSRYLARPHFQEGSACRCSH